MYSVQEATVHHITYSNIVARVEVLTNTSVAAASAVSAVAAVVAVTAACCLASYAALSSADLLSSFQSVVVYTVRKSNNTIRSSQKVLLIDRKQH